MGIFLQVDLTSRYEQRHDLVRNWRLECLIRAGYPRREALELSELRDLDLHRAVRLLERGCTVETALRIPL